MMSLRGKKRNLGPSPDEGWFLSGPDQSIGAVRAGNLLFDLPAWLGRLVPSGSPAQVSDGLYSVDLNRFCHSDSEFVLGCMLIQNLLRCATVADPEGIQEMELGTMSQPERQR